MELCTWDFIWYFPRGRVIVHANGARIRLIFASIRTETNALSVTILIKSAQQFFSFSTVYDDVQHSLRKRLTFRDATTGYPAKWHLRKELINSVFYPDLGGASDCMKQIFNQSEVLPRSG